jgi:hypothetical protein
MSRLLELRKRKSQQSESVDCCFRCHICKNCMFSCHRWCCLQPVNIFVHWMQNTIQCWKRPSNDTRTMCQKISRPTDFKALKVYKKKEERSLQRRDRSALKLHLLKDDNNRYKKVNISSWIKFEASTFTSFFAQIHVLVQLSFLSHIPLWNVYYHFNTYSRSYFFFEFQLKFFKKHWILVYMNLWTLKTCMMKMTSRRQTMLMIATTFNWT